MMPGSKGLSPHEFAEYFALYLDKEHTKKELPVFEQSKKWLDLYFPAGNRILMCLCILPGQILKMKCRPLPPGCGSKRQPDRICRRN